MARQFAAATTAFAHPAIWMRDLWRIRIRIDGSAWRVVYQVRMAERLVVVTRVARRDEGTYRGIAET